jgi:RNA polymerase sigma-70 factor (ECF subfamily)
MQANPATLAALATLAAQTDERQAEERRWIAASLDGDRDAFAELVRRYQQRVFRLAGRFFRRPEDVEEVAQETFLTAWRKLHTYAGRAPFEHWLTRVCTRCCYARLRRRPDPEPLAEVDRPVDPGDPSAGVELERLLARLKTADRMVLLLLDGEGWTTAEIAERLGWTRTNVKVRAHRARARLRRLVEEDLER